METCVKQMLTANDYSTKIRVWVPGNCDIDKFYDEISKAGVWYEPGELKDEGFDYFREITIKETDITKFSMILNTWGVRLSMNESVYLGS